MNILLCNTSERTGGAAIAARRLAVALRAAGADARMWVRDRAAYADGLPVLTPRAGRMALRARFIAERLGVLLAGSGRRRLFEVDTATHGVDLTHEPCYAEADVVHLHWVNQGLLSLRGLERVLQGGKPVVWTLHDMWPLTGICHHAGDCDGWLHGCGHCPLLRLRRGAGDASARCFQRKRRVYDAGRIHFVACSDWLADLARRAPLLQGHVVHSIPNAIDTDFYSPADRTAARRKLGLPEQGDLLLFVAYKATDKNKGVDYLRQAVRQLAATDETLQRTLQVVIVGREATTLRYSFAVKAHTREYVSDEATMRDFYRAATLLCMPTLQDNLPNTIVEAMSCGTPTVGFRVGGLPQLIEHGENGYLATYKDASDFAHGLAHCLEPVVRQHMAEFGRERAVTMFSEPAVAATYMKVYETAMWEKGSN